MRVAGYARELPAGGESLYAQSERVRRWTSEHGYQLISMCQDVRGPNGEPRGDGFRALMEVVSTRHADAVVVASLDILSPDLLMQEVILHDLRGRDVSVISTREEDAQVLSDPRLDPARLLVRDILDRRAQYEDERLAPPQPERLPGSDDDVVIELVTVDEHAS
jgi:DNA invertase Pin-like site-specific DNA recombinase